MDYSAEVQRRFLAPPCAGALPGGAPGVVAGEAEDRALNVWIRFQVEVRAGFVQTARFQAYGCPHTIAAASWLAERVEGGPVDGLQRRGAREVGAALDVPVEKFGKLLRLEDALAECRRAAAAVGEPARRAHGEAIENGRIEKGRVEKER